MKTKLEKMSSSGKDLLVDWIFRVVILLLSGIVVTCLVMLYQMQ